MNKREKIIVGLALVFSLYALVNYLFFQNNPTNTLELSLEKQKEQIEQYSQQAIAELLAIDQTIKNPSPLYVINKIENPWQTDPFRSIFVPTETIDDEQEDTNIPEIIYSGFIQIGSTYMAVIDGMEYMVGETMKDIGYKISQITPIKVVLTTQSNKEVILYLEGN